MRYAVVLQWFGIGDVIFSRTAIELYDQKEGPYDDIFWPVRPEWVDGLSRAYSGRGIGRNRLHFIDYRTCGIDFERRDWESQSLIWEGKSYVVENIPLRWCVQLMKVPYQDCMKSKYSMFRQDWQKWKKHGMFRRDASKEAKLFQVLGLRPNEPYVLENRRFRQDETGIVTTKAKDTCYSNAWRHVEMRSIEGFSLFDWAGVIENAREIHTVSTSIIYIFELLAKLKPQIFIYIRKPDEKSHRNYDYLLTSNDYVLME